MNTMKNTLYRKSLNGGLKRKNKVEKMTKKIYER